MQAQIDTTTIQNFLLSMVGLSVAAERVTETIKQWICPTAGSANPKGLSAATVQLIAIVSGIIVTALSTLNPLGIKNADFSYQNLGWRNVHMWLNWIVTGILVSGGSAFWNHLLDMLQAAKVQKEKLAYGTAPQQVVPAPLPAPVPLAPAVQVP